VAAAAYRPGRPAGPAADAPASGHARPAGRPAAGAPAASAGVPALGHLSGAGGHREDTAGPREFLLALQTAGLGALTLLAFLSCLSLAARFPGFGDVQRGVYVTALVLAALATGLLLAPAACHRRMSRRRAPGQVIRVVNAMAAGGLAAAGLAISAAVRLAARWAAPAGPADLAGAGTAIVFAVTWFVLPALLSRGPDARLRTQAAGRDGGRPEYEVPGRSRVARHRPADSLHLHDQRAG